MKRYGVSVPLVGYYYCEVEAENEQEAIEKALDYDYDDFDIQEEFSIEKVCEGNVCHHPLSSICIMEIKKD